MRFGHRVTVLTPCLPRDARGGTAYQSPLQLPNLPKGPVWLSENFSEALVLHGQNIGAITTYVARSLVEVWSAGGNGVG